MNSNTGIELSVIVPVYKAESSIQTLLEKLSLSLKKIGVVYEVICVDDNSPDNSLTIMQAFTKTMPEVSVYSLAKNYGQLVATTCGIRLSRGRILITIDDDMQFNPDDLIGLYHFFNANSYRLVFGIPLKRKSAKFLSVKRTLATVLFKYVIMPRYRKTNFFSSLRIFDSALFRADYKNLYYIWQIPTGSIGNYRVSHQHSLKPQSSYTLWKRLKHFEPYMLFACRKSSFALFLSLLLSHLLLIYLYEATVNLVPLYFVLFLIFVASHIRLAQKEKIIYTLKD